MMNKLILTVLFTAAFAAVFSQATLFGVFKFIATPGYTKQSRQGALAFSTANNAKGIYSIILLYANQIQYLQNKIVQ